MFQKKVKKSFGNIVNNKKNNTLYVNVSLYDPWRHMFNFITESVTLHYVDDDNPRLWLSDSQSHISRYTFCERG